jgi:type II secretory pathway pseudopilin PulG
MNRIRRTPASPRSTQRGLMLIGLLIMMLFTSVLAMMALDFWATTRQREREAELLFVGDQIRQAIRRYYFAAPSGQQRVLPQSLQDLVEDTRSTITQHHLRRVYADPISGDIEWGLVMRGDRLAGVYSQSDAKPIKQTGFEFANAAFEGKETYRDWVFLFLPPTQTRRR